jgi:anti-anti-sigma factor
MTIAMTESTVIPLCGELDTDSANALRARLAQASIDFDGEAVTLDMSGVTFIDSTGLGILVGATRSMRSTGGDIRLAGCRPGMVRVLSIAGLDRFFVLTMDAEVAPVG